MYLLNPGIAHSRRVVAMCCSAALACLLLLSIAMLANAVTMAHGPHAAPTASTFATGKVASVNPNDMTGGPPNI